MDRKEQGKINRKKGKMFELEVRKHLESQGYIVSKWMNNVEFYLDTDLHAIVGKIVPAKNKFNPFMKVMMMSGGFPDFIVYKNFWVNTPAIRGVECKMNGKLDRKERQQCDWYIENHVFDKILIAKRGKDMYTNKDCVWIDDYVPK